MNKLYMVFDTETCNCPKIDGQLDTKNAQFYDFGLQIIDIDGKVYCEYSIVNEDVFFGMPQAMREAYFAEKIPQYVEGIHNKSYLVMNTVQIRNLIRQLCKEYDIAACIAHNARFDITATNATLRYQTKSRYRWFFPYGMPILDTMKMAKATICQDEKYITYCKNNGYMTNHPVPQVRKTAEILWRYLTQNDEFIESHTGLEDVKIEAQIFVTCAKMDSEGGDALVGRRRK